MLQIGILLVSLSEYLVRYIDCQGKLCMVRVQLFKESLKVRIRFAIAACDVTRKEG